MIVCFFSFFALMLNLNHMTWGLQFSVFFFFLSLQTQVIRGNSAAVCVTSSSPPSSSSRTTWTCTPEHVPTAAPNAENASARFTTTGSTCVRTPRPRWTVSCAACVAWVSRLRRTWTRTWRARILRRSFTSVTYANTCLPLWKHVRTTCSYICTLLVSNVKLADAITAPRKRSRGTRAESAAASSNAQTAVWPLRRRLPSWSTASATWVCCLTPACAAVATFAWRSSTAATNASPGA